MLNLGLCHKSDFKGRKLANYFKYTIEATGGAVAWLNQGDAFITNCN